MNRILLTCFLCLPSVLTAQALDLAALRAGCVPAASESTLRAIIQVESGSNPNAMQIDFPHALLTRWQLSPGTLRLSRQPKDRQEALAWLAYFEGMHVFVDLGLMQVSTSEANRRGIDPASLLEPCINLQVGWRILQEAYQTEVKRYGRGQTALQHAISRYNTGNSQQGIDNGYLARVVAAADSIDSDHSHNGRQNVR